MTIAKLALPYLINTMRNSSTVDLLISRNFPNQSDYVITALLLTTQVSYVNWFCNWCY